MKEFFKKSNVKLGPKSTKILARYFSSNSYSLLGRVKMPFIF